MKVLKLNPDTRNRYILSIFTFWIPLIAAFVLFYLILTNAENGIVGLYMQLWRTEYLLLLVAGLLTIVVKELFMTSPVKRETDEYSPIYHLMPAFEMLAIASLMAYLDVFKVFYIFTAAN